MSAYDRMAQQAKKRPRRQNKKLTSFQDSDISQRSQPGNVFLDSSQQYLDDQTLKVNIAQHISSSKQRNKQQPNRMPGSNNKLRMKDQSEPEIQLIDDQEVPQGQEVEENTQFSIFQSMKYYLGHVTNTTQYPLNRLLFIDNYNEDENIVNRKHSMKKKGTKLALGKSNSNQYFFNNQIKISSVIFWIHLIWNSFVFHLDFYLYLGIIVIGFIVQKALFQGNAQYVGDPIILAIMIGFSLIGRFILQALLVRKRKNFEENQEKYKVYSHDGISAEWMNLEATQIKSGNIFKISEYTKFPTDCLLIHSIRSIVTVDEDQIKGKISQTLSSNKIKETVIKSENIVLPISGVLEYRLNNSEITNNWIEGKLTLQEPLEIVHSIDNSNVVFKGSVNTSPCELLCMALDVGVNSIHLKNSQYPYIFKDFEKIYEKCPQVLTIQKISKYLIYISVGIYAGLSSIGLLIGFLTKNLKDSHYYIGNEVKVAYLAFYHFTNFIIFVPIWLQLALLLYSYLMGKNIESNISTRQFELQPFNNELKKQYSNNEGTQIIDKKAETIGKVNIKDYSILPYLKDEYVLITSIDSFKDSVCKYKLKKIKVKQIYYEFGKDSFETLSFNSQSQQLIKYFVAVSLLSTYNLQGKQQAQTQSASFQQSIRNKVREEFNIKLNFHQQFTTIGGPLDNVFADGQLKVIHYFTIDHSAEFPYTVQFYEIPTQEIVENRLKKLLCIVRGDPETILMKAYGKTINLLTQCEKIHQQTGQQIQFLGKFTLFYQDAEELKNLYTAPTTRITKFFSTFEQHFKKIEPMGVLIFQNQFAQQPFSKSKHNQFLNLGLFKNIDSGADDNSSKLSFSSQNLPPIILISPQPQSFYLHPQFESVHSVTNLLTNPLLFNFPLSDISQKILHDPIRADDMLQKLSKQRVIVWNGWNHKNIRLMLSNLHQKGVRSICYIEKDQYLYLTKICDLSLGNQGYGNDIAKYTDIDIIQRASTSKVTWLLTIIQLLVHDSKMMQRGLYCIILIHMVKLICYGAVEVINFAYTLGTGISVIRLPLFAVTELVTLFEGFFYINVGDKASSYRLKQPSMIFEAVKTTVLVILMTLIMVYSSITPHGKEGAPVNSVFCVLHVHLLITHIIIFSKVFWVQSINLYQIFIIVLQLITYYAGILIVSETSLYEFKGVFAYLFNNKLYMVSIILVWMFLMAEVGKIVTKSINLNKPKAPSSNTYQQLKRIKQGVTKLDSVNY